MDAQKQHFKVIHIELNEPFQGKRHHYFGSKTAIYEYLTPEQVGISLKSLWNIDLEAGEYKNRLCIIRMGILIRKSTHRGGNRKGGNDDNIIL